MTFGSTFWLAVRALTVGLMGIWWASEGLIPQARAELLTFQYVGHRMFPVGTVIATVTLLMPTGNDLPRAKSWSISGAGNSLNTSNSFLTGDYWVVSNGKILEWGFTAAANNSEGWQETISTANYSEAQGDQENGWIGAECAGPCFNNNPGTWTLISRANAPNIYFNDANITGTTQTVVAGQQITLSVSPAGSGVATPWSVSGSPIGGYTYTQCEGITCPAGSINPPNFTDPVNATFYWYIPTPDNGTYTVTYSYLDASNTTQSVQVAFQVVAPAGVNILPDSNLQFGESRFIYGDYDPEGFYKNPPYFSCGDVYINPCITFNASSTNNYLGYNYSLEWVQLIVLDDYTASNASQTQSCVTMPGGLDKFYPYDVGVKTADSPAVSVKNWTSAKRFFRARMFLLWNPGLSGSIFVPLGFVDWGWRGGAAVKDGHWQAASPVDTVYMSPINTQPTYPTWSAAAKCEG